ncbi:hypothetical protein LIER_36697 [Lithospermum erythrorhizon]|uniref:Uncharacterized protein n=1 Tax=Lithospermum erythrorhizon TaxID=34254 RepID=A0AAV3PB86_LITER
MANEQFRRVAEDCGIFDIGFSGFPYTWCNNFTSPHSTRGRLDRGLASKDWMMEFPDNSRLGLLNWKHVALGNVRRSIESKHSSLDSLNQGLITNGSKVLALSLGKEIDKLRGTNDIYWRQHARLEWRVKGDRNTTYFHALSSHKGTLNLISTLQDDNGMRITDPHDIQWLAAEFYQKLFTSESSLGLSSLAHLSMKRINSSQKTMMDTPFLPIEVKGSFFSIKGNKSPGPDG